ncbi:hypothetical protein F5Y13DRAFT_163847 [Hypoxylon sp. FL1857]|nr:hypothetical protein F5Y13DRAFT_163847 [Hypoxylon sp. FL1857]
MYASMMTSLLYWPVAQVSPLSALQVSLFASLLLGANKWQSYLRGTSDGTVRSLCSSAPPGLFIVGYRRRDLDAWVGPLIFSTTLALPSRTTRLAHVHSGLATALMEGCKNHCTMYACTIVYTTYPAVVYRSML